MEDFKVMVMVKFSVDGVHNFPDAWELFPEVDFLTYAHRHMFHFTAACRVMHNDRDKEFIMLKRDMLDYAYKKYHDSRYRTHVFGSRSCEMLAEELLSAFGCEWVECWEDNENGARVERV
jgi:hypothetical protein